MKSTKNSIIIYFCYFSLVAVASVDGFRTICIPSDYFKLIKPLKTVEENISIVEIRVDLENIQILNINENKKNIQINCFMLYIPTFPKNM